MVDRLGVQAGHDDPGGRPGGGAGRGDHPEVLVLRLADGGRPRAAAGPDGRRPLPAEAGLVLPPGRVGGGDLRDQSADFFWNSSRAAGSDLGGPGGGEARVAQPAQEGVDAIVGRRPGVEPLAESRDLGLGQGGGLARGGQVDGPQPEEHAFVPLGAGSGLQFVQREVVGGGAPVGVPAIIPGAAAGRKNAPFLDALRIRPSANRIAVGSSSRGISRSAGARTGTPP
ncbi:hypothetical protein VT85_13255 [Planctomyces sp. SH-PL62]|nr:hypothetical protein VT85_13255 [Planctomyces sp. SH-PL62]